MVSHSSESNANSASRNWGPLCNCGRATTVVKAWTNENPGKRFFRCGAHGFFDWADVEKAYSWQKVSLLEARMRFVNRKRKSRHLKNLLRP
ncbi:unnamed protein product [Arabidopsis thaliana]|uniref:Zinc finger GRF-type domain-containing protein n=1 Tax=Arabidopsis thaliana TaxID=3702 RepID=A0A654EHV3_ARATH|nr:unnamed protein product [Arabidopsis thaliana]